jgi:hypothetical protein
MRFLLCSYLEFPKRNHMEQYSKLSESKTTRFEKLSRSTSIKSYSFSSSFAEPAWVGFCLLPHHSEGEAALPTAVVEPAFK